MIFQTKKYKKMKTMNKKKMADSHHADAYG